jgi:hypothetical protein
MTTATRRLILRANALFLGIGSVGAFVLLDLRGIVLRSSGELDEVPGSARLYDLHALSSAQRRQALACSRSSRSRSAARNASALFSPW